MTTVALTDQNLMPSTNVWTMIKEQASMLVNTGFLPNGIKTPQQAAAIMLKGRELGIPPMQAFGQINVIQGKPCVSPELMLALIFRNIPTAEINFVQLDDKACKIKARRTPTQPLQNFSFSIEDAAKAGLASKDNWKKYTRAMLRSRCVGEMGRSLFPDALMGCSYTPEEMGANVNEEMEIITPEIVKEKTPTPQQQDSIDDLKRKATAIMSVLPDELITKTFKLSKSAVYEKMVDEKSAKDILVMLKTLEAKVEKK